MPRCVIGYEWGPAPGEDAYLQAGNLKDGKTTHKEWIKRDVRKLVGTVPVIGGIYAGVMEITDSVGNKGLENKGWHVLRGVVQILGLGALYTIADVAVSFCRGISYLMEDKSKF